MYMQRLDLVARICALYKNRVLLLLFMLGRVTGVAKGVTVFCHVFSTQISSCCPNTHSVMIPVR